MATLLLVRARLIGADDISFGRNSIVYVNYLGVTHTIAQVNASHIPIVSQDYKLEDLFAGSNYLNIYPVNVDASGTGDFGGDLTTAADLSAVNATLSGNLTITGMNVAGYVKNTAAGLLTGGNGITLAASDIPSSVITGAAAYGVSVTGTDAYEVTFSPALAAYEAGQLLAFMPDTSNTGACSLDANSIGAVAIKQIIAGVQADPLDGSILVDEIAYVVYNGDSGTFVLINPASLPSQTDSSNVQVFTTDGNWTRPVSVTVVRVLAIGAGGGGGGSTAVTGGGSGGGGGSVVTGTVDVSADATVAVTIGVAGTGGAGANPGTAGSDTSFGAFIVATGGGGGLAGAGAVGAGGVSTLYTTQGDHVGFDGYDGIVGDAGAGAREGGAGGDSGSHRGEGGAGGDAGTPVGTDGGDYGAGGGGGYTSGATNEAGGDGAPGLCVIWW